MISLYVKALKEERGGQEGYEIKTGLPDIEGDDGSISFAGPAEINIDLTNAGYCILLTGKISVSLALNCARCLDPFSYNLQTSFFETYYDQEKGLPKNADNSEEFIPFQGNHIDIEPEVIKAILLALPIRVLCDPACKGLCAQCGTNLNVETCSCEQEDFDPRMLKLKELLDK